ncbi:glutathione S-transferase family protein [Sediminicoccus rosea]|uniref:Glutathione S-transferase family protein n=1 Tax=Sediminicoccus rosea TaxID=1225128 RepID=A0ABZ0PEV5_9PROT|nr:glutathione S-transferase family protein [Sediminicoccus rosea]WPB84155.1 glutathione S-transferase family protein [Sediminicoccus rosea]
MKLHYFDGSTTCRPIVMFAHEAGLPLELVPVNLFTGEHKGEAYTGINPNQLVPVLEEADGHRLIECSAILKYLADLAAHPAWPADRRARAAVNARMDWFNTGFYRVFGYGLVYGQILPDYMWSNAAMQAAAVERAEAKSRTLMTILNDHMLSDAAPFLGGAEPDLSDHLGACYVTLGELVGFDFAPWPRVQRWIAAMKARPSWEVANGGFNAWRGMLQGAA